ERPSSKPHSAPNAIGSTTARMICTATGRSRNNGGGHTLRNLLSSAVRVRGHARDRTGTAALPLTGRSQIELEEPLRVAAVDLILLCCGETEPFDRPLDRVDGLARVHAGLGLERHVGGEHDAVDAEELEAALRGRSGAEQRGVGVEATEVVDRPLLHRAQQRLVVDVGGPGAELIPAVADAALEVR